MANLPFKYFDCDNHFYEAEDAFTRHIPKGLEKRTMQWAQIDGKKRLLVAGKINRFIPNPTFDPIAKPGAMDEYSAGAIPSRAACSSCSGSWSPFVRSTATVRHGWW